MNQICPYPGLRPFNEDESIFFKGREDHIDKIISQLQERKFLMVTGASGDGKSSLIYAGLIPRSRAGFFKARYNNWLVADLRPERAPLSNLGASLNSHFKLDNVNDLEEDLSYGFSSLVKVYKESEFYLDTTTSEYKNANDDEKQELKNKSANLLILIDQFEELFTNSENFSNGKASRQAITLINLIIETTKIAEKEDLPIYIVCTMRSDYVGDCAIFKGFPELIVYSQFFVPRLKRQEIHRAILEPARLSGNKINNRLIERLINELGEGQDQLPILQHSLNRIWKTHADDNAVEMDVIHYAKVGGCDASILPLDQKKIFSEWYSIQPLYKQKILENPCMANVLNAHARELFEKAVNYCRNHIGREIPKEEAHERLKNIFTCLTKINDNRAVRNRSTILEIKQLVGEDIGIRLIEGLVNIFRESENTLLRPFISNDKGNVSLNDNDTLDITHESLIRNWSELELWTKEEHENVLVLADFKKQVNRWEENKRSKDYFLTTGSLSYFKEWQEKLKPNPYLFAKFDEENISFDLKVKKANQFIHAGDEFIQTSENSIKRKRRTAYTIAAAVIMVLIGFTSWAFIERGTALDQTQIANQKTQEAIVFGQQAQNSEQIALLAKNNALILKDKAIESERIALSAKQLAEKSKQEALTAKAIAESEKRNAQEQTEVAKTEKENAEKQKNIASNEKKKAEDSEKDAKKSFLLSLAQSIALKSPLYKDDPQLQTLLALQAYTINKDNNVTDKDPLVYDALRYALTVINKNNNNSISTASESRALFENNDTLFFADRNGLIFKENILKFGDKNLSSLINSYKSPIDILAFSPDGKVTISAHDNYALCLWNLQKQQILSSHQELLGHKGLIRTISFSSDGSHFATGGKDSLILVWKMENGKTNLEKSLVSNSAIKSILYSSDGNKIISLQENGKIIEWDVITSIKNEIDYSGNSKPVSFDMNRLNNTIIIGLSNGSIWIQNLSKNTHTEIKAHIGAVDYILFNKDCSLFATAGSDKKIKIYNADNLDETPLSITNLNTKVKSIIFTSNGKLVVGCMDKKIHLFEPSSKKIAEELYVLLKRNMTQEEWTKFYKNIPYDKTKKELE